MKRSSSIVLLGMLLAVGCSHNYYAERMVTPDPSSGRMYQDLIGKGEQALKANHIDMAIECIRPDGAAISAWVIKAPPPGSMAAMTALYVPPTAVLLHGLGEGKANYLGVAKRLSAKGMNVVLIDLRGHGCSSDKYTTYGAKEKDDVKAVLDEVDKKGLKIGDVFVFGTTLGGCVAFQYAAIDPRCKGVMAIAPYRDATTVARRIAFVLAPTMSEADFRQALAEGAKMADFDPASASAVDAAKKLTCPVLVVNALLDVTVQIDWSQAVYDAAGGPKRFIVVTPGPEQLALVMIWEDWIADRMADLAHGKLDGYKSPATQPGK